MEIEIQIKMKITIKNRQNMKIEKMKKIKHNKNI